MKIAKIVLGCLICTALLWGCKEDKKEPEVIENQQIEGPKSQVKKVSEETKRESQSVFSRAMTTSELKTFVSAAVSAGMANELMKGEGPFTLIAPSNDAFETLTATTKNRIMNTSNVGELKQILQNHIIEGNVSSADLLQQLRGKSTITVETLGGATYTLFLQDEDLMLKDSNGKLATVGKSDITGSNGTLHIIGAVLGVE